MKYPRSVNALLDAGMILTLLASAGLLFAILVEGVNEPHMTIAMVVLIVGVGLVASATCLSKVRRQPIDEHGPILRRVK